MKSLLRLSPLLPMGAVIVILMLALNSLSTAPTPTLLTDKTEANTSRDLPTSTGAGSGKTRLYYIAADEVEWDYAPTGSNQISGQPFSDMEKVYVQSGPNLIGKVNLKAIYREYTDASFTKLKPRPRSQDYLGLLGPIIRAEVGDTIKVIFKNKSRYPATVHPHGVVYKKNAEGAPYNDGTSGPDKADDGVLPNQTHTYIWEVPERSGPGPNDPSSIVWLYHSHYTEAADIYAGMVGAIIVTRKGLARPDGTPKDVDREFINLYMIMDENMSTYLDDNIQMYTGLPAQVKKDDPDFEEGNKKHSINGYIFGNMPMMKMKEGEKVRWYLLGLGNEGDIHTIHWHGNTVLHQGSRTDVVSVTPAVMTVADMVADAPGVWLYHCHVADHMMAGMMTRYKVMTASEPNDD